MGMFRGHRRKARVLFSATDIVLLALAFLFAYWTRQRLELQHFFYLDPPHIALLLGWSMLVWVALGYWWEIYDRIDAALPRVAILRDAFSGSAWWAPDWWCCSNTCCGWTLQLPMARRTR